MSLAEFIRSCRQWGCDCVELLDVCFPKTDEAFLASLRREAFLQSIDLSGTSVYTDFLHAEKSPRDAELEKVRQWIDYTARMGASLLVVFPGPNRRDLTMAESVRRVTDSVLRVADHAQSQGVMLGLENHGVFKREPLGILEVIDKVDHPWTGINLDTGNVASKPYENMAALVPKAVNCHLKLEVFDGKKSQPADLERKFRILRDGGFRGCVTLQYELRGNPLEEVPKHLETIQALARPMDDRSPTATDNTPPTR